MTIKERKVFQYWQNEQSQYRDEKEEINKEVKAWCVLNNITPTCSFDQNILNLLACNKSLHDKLLYLHGKYHDADGHIYARTWLGHELAKFQ